MCIQQLYVSISKNNYAQDLGAAMNLRIRNSGVQNVVRVSNICL